MLLPSLPGVSHTSCEHVLFNHKTEVIIILTSLGCYKKNELQLTVCSDSSRSPEVPGSHVYLFSSFFT